MPADTYPSAWGSLSLWSESYWEPFAWKAIKLAINWYKRSAFEYRPPPGCSSPRRHLFIGHKLLKDLCQKHTLLIYINCWRFRTTTWGSRLTFFFSISFQPEMLLWKATCPIWRGKRCIHSVGQIAAPRGCLKVRNIAGQNVLPLLHAVLLTD